MLKENTTQLLSSYALFVFSLSNLSVLSNAVASYEDNSKTPPYMHTSMSVLPPQSGDTYSYPWVV